MYFMTFPPYHLMCSLDQNANFTKVMLDLDALVDHPLMCAQVMEEKGMREEQEDFQHWILLH